MAWIWMGRKMGGGLGGVEQGEIQAGVQVILWEKNISFNYKEKNEKRKRSNLKVEWEEMKMLSGW